MLAGIKASIWLGHKWTARMTTRPEFLSELRSKAQQGVARRLFADADRTDEELLTFGA
ncbi:MAG: hypothetical protein ACI87W_003417, partial [Halieaceae bacterium]